MGLPWEPSAFGPVSDARQATPRRARCLHFRRRAARIHFQNRCSILWPRPAADSKTGLRQGIVNADLSSAAAPRTTRTGSPRTLGSHSTQYLPAMNPPYAKVPLVPGRATDRIRYGMKVLRRNFAGSIFDSDAVGPWPHSAAHRETGSGIGARQPGSAIESCVLLHAAESREVW